MQPSWCGIAVFIELGAGDVFERTADHTLHGDAADKTVGRQGATAAESDEGRAVVEIAGRADHVAARATVATRLADEVDEPGAVGFVGGI